MFYVVSGTVYSSHAALEAAGADPATAAQFETYAAADAFAANGPPPAATPSWVVAGSVFADGAAARACAAKMPGVSARAFDSVQEAQLFALFDAAAVDVVPKAARVAARRGGPAMAGVSVADATAKGVEVRRKIEAAMRAWVPSRGMEDALTFASEMKKKATPLKKTSVAVKNKLAKVAGDNAEDDVVDLCSDIEQEEQEESSSQQPTALDPYQAEAVAAALRGESFFLTGSAGTGKSFVLKQIISTLRSGGKTVAVTASTGCAAVGIQGTTIHSCAKLGLGMTAIEKMRRKASVDMVLRKRFHDIDVLVIDEISMIDRFLFDKLEAVTSAACAPVPATFTRNGTNGYASAGHKSYKGRRAKGSQDEPVPRFGPIQIITCGDFFQLPPVAASDARHKGDPEKHFCFEADAWKEKIAATHELQVVHRQADQKFAGMLNEIRRGIVSEQTNNVLDACRIAPRINHVECDAEGKRLHFTKLFSFRNQVGKENTFQLSKLASQGVRYKSMDVYEPEETELDAMRNIATAGLRNLNVEREVEIKEGARVLCLKNLDQEKGIVNGTSGVVVGFSLPQEVIRKRREAEHKRNPDSARERSEKSRSFFDSGKDDSIAADDIRESETMSFDCDDGSIAMYVEKAIRDPISGVILQDSFRPDVCPIVKFDNGVTRRIEHESWDVYGPDGSLLAHRYQVPLMLGWALSIHKSQGMTLEYVETDLERAFDCGQVYVALSRVTSVFGLRLRSFARNKVAAHDKVIAFDRKSRQSALGDGSRGVSPPPSQTQAILGTKRRAPAPPQQQRSLKRR